MRASYRTRYRLHDWLGGLRVAGQARYSREEQGTVGGAVAGGVVGNAVTGGSTIGTVGGAVVGGVVGNEAGERYDEKKRKASKPVRQ